MGPPETGFWDWKIGDVAAVVTASVAATLGIVGFVAPWVFKWSLKRWGQWPLAISIDKVAWNRASRITRTPDLIDGVIRFNLTVRPRWKTSKHSEHPSILSWTATVNGSPEFSGGTGGLNFGNKVTDHSVDIPWKHEDFMAYGIPSRITLTFRVSYMPNNDQFISVNTNKMCVHQDPSLTV